LLFNRKNINIKLQAFCAISTYSTPLDFIKKKPIFSEKQKKLKHPNPPALLSATTEPVLPLRICDDIEFSNDIGDYVKEKGAQISDYNKTKILELSNIPANNFIYPFSTHIKKGKEEKRYLNKTYFEAYKWRVYSPKKNGFYCKYCVLFADKGGKCNNVVLQKLVAIPLVKYAKISGKTGELEVHNSHQYHVNAITTAEYFLFNHKHPQNEVINMVSTHRHKPFSILSTIRSGFKKFKKNC